MSWIHAALLSERQRALEQITSLEHEFNGIVESSEFVATDDDHDPEGHTIAFERQQIAALLRDARSRLADLDDAIARLQAGTYGICDLCGGAIVGERLAVRPAARTCVACANAATSGW